MATKMKAKKLLPLYSSNGSPKTCSTSMSSAAKQHQKQKKVEVRWLQSEAELYLKQWQRRYRQLEGIEDNYHQLSHHFLSNNQLEEYDDWCLTSQRILDLDLELIDNKNINNSNKLVNNCNNNNSCDVFWRREPKLLFTFEDLSKSNDSAVDEEEENIDEDVNEVKDDLKSVENICCSNGRDNHLTPLKNFVNNCSDNESNNEFFRKIIANKKEMMKRNEKQFTLDLKEKLELLSEETSALTASQKAKPRSRDRHRPRVRPPPIRRQLFKCEHPGCQYSSDRNFNFLRHKRTHKKPKSDTNDEDMAFDNNSGNTKPIITNTSNSSEHNISDNEVCDQKELISS